MQSCLTETLDDSAPLREVPQQTRSNAQWFQIASKTNNSEKFFFQNLESWSWQLIEREFSSGKKERKKDKDN